MHTTHSGNRKSKSNSNSISIIGASPEEWSELLKAKCGPPQGASKITPEILEFTRYARTQGYAFRQIAAVVNEKFQKSISGAALSNALNRSPRE